MKYLILIGTLLGSLAVHASGSLDAVNPEKGDGENLFNFVIGSKSSVVARTRSFKSGINEEGELIVAEESDPLSMEFESDENQIQINGDCDGTSDDCDSETLDSDDNSQQESNSGSGKKAISWAHRGLASGHDKDNCYFSSKGCYSNINVKDHNHYSEQGTTSQPSPVPLPCAFWLFGSALLGILGIKRKDFYLTLK